MATTKLPDTEPSLSLYQLRLPTYEGPLDVLLRLIERSQLAIEDVSLVAVTDQFLAYIESLDQADAIVIADFTTVGTRLTVLKSRSLLPKPPVVEEEPEPSDLTQQLREYKRMKDLAVQLGERHAAGLNAYTSAQLGSVVVPKATMPMKLVQYPADSLAKAIRRRLSVVPKPAQLIRQRHVVSLPELVDRLSALITRLPKVRFSHFTSTAVTRTERATAFLAVLVLVRRQTVQAEQDSLFGEIDLIQSTDTPQTQVDSTDEFLN